MKQIAVVYTSMGPLVANLKGKLAAHYPDARIVNIADDSLIRDVIKQDGVSPATSRRLLRYMEAAADSGADVIVCACSSVGDVAELADSLLDIPVVRIDRAMVDEALAKGARIGVLASLSTTLEPTCSLLRSRAQALQKPVTIAAQVAQGAYEALSSGDGERHDQLLRDTAAQLARDCDVLLLAQGSMARMEQELQALTGIPVLSSPELCAATLLQYYKGGGPR